MPDSVSAMKLPIILVDDPGIPGTSKFSPGPASKETLDPEPVIPSPKLQKKKKKLGWEN